MLAMKKAIVDFVLRDPAFIENIGNSESSSTPLRKELVTMSTDWKTSIQQAKIKLERSLFAVNPCLAALLDLWYCNFRKLRLVRTQDLIAHHKAYELQEFQTTVKRHIQEAKKELMERYFAGVVDIFLIGNKKNRLPNPALKNRMKKFFNAVATIMTYHLQTLCLKSLYDYTEYITDTKYKSVGFVILIVQKIDVLSFEPPFKNFSDALIGNLDLIIDAVMTVPRLETQLYMDYQGEPIYLEVSPSYYKPCQED